MRAWICFAAATAIYLAPSQAMAHQPSLNQVLNWLPVDTETVLGANGPFTWAPHAASSDPPQLEIESRVFPLTLLTFENGRPGEFVKNKTISLAIEGSRRFRPPQSLGLMRYEGCLVLIFGVGLPLDGAAFMRQFRSPL